MMHGTTLDPVAYHSIRPLEVLCLQNITKRKEKKKYNTCKNSHSFFLIEQSRGRLFY